MSKRWIFRGIPLLLLTLLLCFVVVGCSSKEEAPKEAKSDKKEVITLRLSSTTTRGADNWYNWYCDKLKETTEKYTDGRVQLKLFGEGELYKNYLEMAKAVMDGSLDMALIIPSSSYSDVGIPEAATIAFPRIFKNEEDIYEFLAREDGYQRVHKILKERGVMTLDSVVFGKYHIYTQKQINTVADAKGLKTRLSAGPVNTIGKMMGFVPTDLPVSDVYIGLQQKTLDACATGLDTYVNRKWYEVANYAPINWPFLYYNVDLITNDKAWNKLSPDLQKIMLEKVMPEMHKFGVEMKEKVWAKMEDDARKAGVNLYNVPDETIKEFDKIIFEKAYPELRKISPLMSDLIDVAMECSK